MPGAVRGFASTHLPLQAKRLVRRRVRNPFVHGRGTTIVHVTHHRVGTVWFGKVLSLIANHFGLSFQSVVPKSDSPESEVLLYHHSWLFDRTRLESFRGSHLIRDPRDVVVSAYHYHLWTNEKWVHIPKQEYRGMTYQQYLRSLDTEEGFAAEIRRMARSDLAEVGAWNYAQPEFLELKYEDFIIDDAAQFARMFRHYGFNETAVELQRRSRAQVQLSKDDRPVDRRGSGGLAPAVREARPVAGDVHSRPQSPLPRAHRGPDRAARIRFRGRLVGAPNSRCSPLPTAKRRPR
jgi:hypothetical protein